MTRGVVIVVVFAVVSMLLLRNPAKPRPLTLAFGMAESSAGVDLHTVDLSTTAPVVPDEQATTEAVADFAVEEATLQVDAAAIVAPVGMDDGAGGTLVDRFGGDDLLADATAALRAPGGGVRATGDVPAVHGASAFFGRGGEGNRVCFLCDNSNSYRDGGFHLVLDELARAVDTLRPDQSFFVVFFSDAAYPLFHPTPATTLAPATPDNKHRLREWLSTVEMCSGGQGIHDAVKLAGTLGAEVVYLLSDGQMAGTTVDRVSRADFGDAVVHTFGMQQSIIDRRTGQIDGDRAREQEGCSRNLITIATAHGGGFTPVAVPPAAAILERLRPIARNRSRGPVWGLRL